MHENRHLRFADNTGLSDHDLPIAAEIWLDDLSRQTWVTREILKLANLFNRYRDQPDPKMLALNSIETECHVDKGNIIEAVRQMYSYGAVKGYAIDNSALRVSLHLPILQRLRAIDSAQQWATQLAIAQRDHHLSSPGRPPQWIPDGPQDDDDVVERFPP